MGDKTSSVGDLSCFSVQSKHSTPTVWKFYHHDQLHHDEHVHFSSHSYCSIRNCSQWHNLNSKLCLHFLCKSGLHCRLFPALQLYSDLQSPKTTVLAWMSSLGLLWLPDAAPAPLSPCCGLQTCIPDNHSSGLCCSLLLHQHSLSLRPLGLSAHGLCPNPWSTIPCPTAEARSLCSSGDPVFSSDLPAAGWTSWTQWWSAGRDQEFMYYGSRPCWCFICSSKDVPDFFDSLRPPTGTSDNWLCPAMEMSRTFSLWLWGGSNVPDSHCCHVFLPALLQCGASTIINKGWAEPFWACVLEWGWVCTVLREQCQSSTHAGHAQTMSRQSPWSVSSAEGLLSKARAHTEQQKYHSSTHRDHRHSAGHRVIEDNNSSDGPFEIWCIKAFIS